VNEAQRDALLARYRVGPADVLGHGGEAVVYALDGGRVLRAHRHEAAEYVRRIADLYGSLDRSAVPYALPEVLEVHGDGEVSWSIERRLPGRPFDELLRRLEGDDRALALRAYVDGAAAFRALGQPPGWRGGCGELFTDERLHAERWGDLLADRLALQLEQARPVLAPAIDDLDALVAPILASARAEEGAVESLVHGDWFPGNVLLDDDLRVSAAIDLGWLTVVGAPDHDILSAAVFCEVRPTHRADDAVVLEAAVARHLGDTAHDALDRVRRYEQLRFAFVTEDEHLHEWCLAGLRTRRPLRG
jgi:aminoglycoside phosphotransferase (APT) family kinase protein